MKFLKYTALFICFVLITAGAGYGVNRYLRDRADSKAEQGKETDVAKQPTGKASQNPTPVVTGAVKLNGTDNVSVQLLEDTVVSTLVEKALTSVVQINASITATDAWGRVQRGTSQGSGIILDADDTTLYIATNHHVIDGSTEIRVTFPDGSETGAALRGSDAAGDLAILTISRDALSEIDPATYSIASLALETPIEVGDMVLALGNALGYGTSVTVGYVSVVDREVLTAKGALYLIQTDAAINPGNSGGALLNMKGEVIGINSMKYSEDYSKIESMGFAIPITQAIPILNELKQLKSFPAEEAGYLGVYITGVTAEMAETFGWPRGVHVSNIVPDSAAADAGILPGDIILSVNGIRVLDSEQLITRVTAYQAGTEILLVVSREDGSGRTELTIPVVLKDRSTLPEE